MAAVRPSIGIVGERGKRGSALALRFGSRGYRIYLGCRDAEAEKGASQLSERLSGCCEAYAAEVYACSLRMLGLKL